MNNIDDVPSKWVEVFWLFRLGARRLHKALYTICIYRFTRLALSTFWHWSDTLALDQIALQITQCQHLHLFPRILILCADVWEQRDLRHVDKPLIDLRLFDKDIEAHGRELLSPSKLDTIQRNSHDRPAERESWLLRR